MATSAAVLCLGPNGGGALEIRQLPRQEPGPDEVEIAVEAASVNPIDVRRSEGHGRRLLSLLGAAKFPLVLGNDFAGTVSAVGARVSSLRKGDRVYGVKPPSARGTHACHVVVTAAHALPAPASRDLQELAALPYSFITMWLAVHWAGLTRQNAPGRKALVHGAAGGLGTLALQMLSAWGASVTAIAKPAAFDACRRSGAVSFVDAATKPFPGLARSFDATLNFATSDDDFALLGCLAEGALGHATTVHPMLQNFDEHGWLTGVIEMEVDEGTKRCTPPSSSKNFGVALVISVSRTNARWRLSRISHSPFTRAAATAWSSLGKSCRKMTIFTSALDNPASRSATYLTIA
jgi:reticulon-4-interacting protein 1, mitochondrial